MVRVFLISDFELLLDGLGKLIRSSGDAYQLVGTAAELSIDQQPWASAAADVILLDLETNPELLLPWLRHWRAQGAPKVLLLSRHDNPALQDKAVLAGARGLLNRHSSPEQLLAALDKVNAGQIWLDREATGRLLDSLGHVEIVNALDPVTEQLHQLTEREQKVLATLLGHAGDPARTLAERLHISESTLRNHLTSIYDKLGVSSRNGLMAHALQHGLAERLAR